MMDAYINIQRHGSSAKPGQPLQKTRVPEIDTAKSLPPKSVAFATVQAVAPPSDLKQLAINLENEHRLQETTITTLRDTLNEKEGQVKDLEKKLKDARSHFRVLDDALKKRESLLDHVAEESASLVEELRRVTEAHGKFQDEAKEFKKEADGVIEEKKKYEARASAMLKKADSDKADLNEEVSRLMVEMKQMKDAMGAAAASSSAEILLMSRQLSDAQQSNSELRASICLLESSLMDQQGKTEAAVQKLASVEDENACMKKKHEVDLNQALSRVDQLMKDLEQARLAVEAKQTELRDSELLLVQAREGHEKELDQKQRELELKNRKLDDHQSEQKTLHFAAQDAKQRVRELEQEHLDVQALWKQKQEEHEAEVREKALQLSRLQDEKKSSESRLQKMEDERVRLQEEKDSVQRKLQDELLVAKRGLDEKDGSIQSLAEQLAKEREAVSALSLDLAQARMQENRSQVSESQQTLISRQHKQRPAVSVQKISPPPSGPLVVHHSKSVADANNSIVAKARVVSEKKKAIKPASKEKKRTGGGSEGDESIFEFKHQIRKKAVIIGKNKDPKKPVKKAKKDEFSFDDSDR